jgi:lysine 2,3-aminomutase
MRTYQIISSLQALGRHAHGNDVADLAGVIRQYPFRTNEYYQGLVRQTGDPMWRQVMPDLLEMGDDTGMQDPLAEEALSPVPNLVHRYPNRVLWLVAHECALHCRFCTRKRRWKSPLPMTGELLRDGLEYIRSHPEINDVLLSGGDPLLLDPSRLETILDALRRIPHVAVVRIGTRVPCALPERVTPELAAVLAKYHPLFVNVHFNHPWEITEESRRACTLLADAGIPLGSQTVLLRGVNDEAQVLGELFQTLLSLRVRPYYLMQMDLTLGTAHFRTPLSRGLKILAQLRNRISGMAMPQLVVDLPGGLGKVPLVPNRIERIGEDNVMIRSYQGALCRYPIREGEAAEIKETLRGVSV